jgi:hypothetical protein
VADDWCDVMEMSRISCVHCRPQTERRRLDAVEADMKQPGGNYAPKRDVRHQHGHIVATVAQYEGRCMADCDEPICVGDPITRTGPGWVHTECFD